MADNNRDVELRIRARDYSQKTLAQLTKITQSLIAVMEEQQRAAEVGEGSNKDLAASYDRLADAGKQLLSLEAAVKTMDNQARALETARQASEKARKANDELRESFSKLDSVTKRQENQLARSNTAVERATALEAKRQATLDRTRESLRRYGIDVSDIATVQQTFTKSVTEINTALEKQQSTMDALPAAQAQNKLRQQAEANRINAQADADRQIAAAQAKADAERAAAAKVAQGLRNQADQAIATANGYRSLGRVIQSTGSAQTQLSRQLGQIVSPTQAARQTVAGLVKEVDALDTEIRAAGPGITDTADKMRDLVATQKGLVQIAAGIDAYQKQLAVLRQARQGYVDARAEIQRLALGMKQGGEGATEMAAKMTSAQAALRTAANSLRTATQAARDSREQLRQAGVNTSNLAQTQTTLTKTARQSASAVTQLAKATKEGTEQSSKMAAALRTLGNNRQTLDLFQRIRGEILAMTTAYVGLQGVINQASGAVDAYKVRQQALIKIGQVVGNDNAALAEQWDYMVGLSNKLGINLSVLSNSYTKFAVSAKAAGMNMQETRFIFESVAKAGRVFALSADDMDGVFRALEQMLSKGQVYAEELRGQLGERLPGAVAMFAKSLGMTIPELNKQLENGMITARDVLNFAGEVSRSVDAQVANASKSVQAVEARLQNSMMMFQLAIADSGFLNAYADAVDAVAAKMQTAEGREAAAKLGELFTAAAQAAIWLTENLDKVELALKALGFIIATQAMTGFVTMLAGWYDKFVALRILMGPLITQFWQWQASLVAAGGAAGALGVALKGLLRFIPYVGLAIMAWELGKILYEYSEDFRNFVDKCALYVRGFGELLNTMAVSLATMWEDLIRLSWQEIQRLGTNAVKSITSSMADLAEKIPGYGRDMANSLRSLGDSMTGPQEDFHSRTIKLWDDLGKRWSDMQDEFTAKQKKESDKRLAKAYDEYARARAISSKQETFDYTQDPGTGTTPEQRKATELQKTIDGLNKQADQANKSAREALVRKSLSGRLKLLDEEMAPLYAKAKELGGKATDDAIAELDKLKAKRQEIERLEYTQATSSTAREDKRKKAIEALRQEYDRLAASVQVQEAKADPNTSYADRLSAALAKVNVQYDQLAAKADKIGGREGSQFKGQIEGLRKVALATEEVKLRQSELERLQGKVTSLQNTRKAGIEEINSLREAGLISEEEQVKRTNQLYRDQNAEINKAILALQQYIMTIKDQMTPEQLALINAEIAKMQAGMANVAAYTKRDMATVNAVVDGTSTALDGVAQGIAGVIDGSMTWGEAMQNLGDIMRKFFADLLMQIAQAIIKQQILNMMSGWGGGIGAAATAAGGTAGAAVLHSGGLVSGSGGTRRNVSASWFSGAPKFHSGGLVGVKQDEVPAILQKGEEVLTADDPRHTNNGGAQSGAVGIYNMIDTDSLTSAVMSNAKTRKAVINIIRADKQAIKNILG